MTSWIKVAPARTFYSSVWPRSVLIKQEATLQPWCFLRSPEIKIADLIQWRWSIGSWMKIRPATYSLATACGQWHNPFLGYSLTPLCPIMMTFKSSHLLGERACLRLDSWLHSEWLAAMQTCNSRFVSEEKMAMKCSLWTWAFHLPRWFI